MSTRPTRQAAALLCLVFAAASCAPHRPSAVRTEKAVAAEYMAVARPANRRLEVAVDSFNRVSRTDLARAKADLREEAAAELWFDLRLIKIAFPPAITAVARALVRANNQRIRLTKLQARAGTIAALLALDGPHRAADAAVEEQVRQIRKDLGLPPPESS